MTMKPRLTVSRRAVLGAAAAAAASSMFRPFLALAQTDPLTRPIPSSGERLPVVGLGSWITFNVGNDPELQDECAAVMQAFFAAGGRLIDSSPIDRKSTRLNSSHSQISYAVFCLKKKKQ